MRVLVADDHPLLCDALRAMVASLPQVGTVDAAVDLPGLLALDGEAPTLVLVDLNMPGMDGVQGVRRIVQRWPGTPVWVLSAQDDAGTVRAARAAGAAGFIGKRESSAVIGDVVRAVLSGEADGARLVGWHSVAPAEHAGGDAAALQTLTVRQREVLALLQRGLPNKAIANALGLSEATVKVHVAAILRVLRARNRSEAIVRSLDLGTSARD